jgi:hypothetical protein
MTLSVSGYFDSLHKFVHDTAGIVRSTCNAALRTYRSEMHAHGRLLHSALVGSGGRDRCDAISRVIGLGRLIR